MGCGYNDIYVLAPERTAGLALGFLDTFVPTREPSASEYEFPEYGPSPRESFTDYIKAIHYCADRPGEGYGFYFRNTASDDPAHAMLFFTPDGGMILGVSIHGRDEDRPREAADITDWLLRLRGVSAARVGYALWESAPPRESVAEFTAALAVALPPKLVDGEVVPPAAGEFRGATFLT